MKADITIYARTPDKLFILDNANYAATMSVTNDAEAVVAFCHKNYPAARIIYKDTDGHWDELLHKDGVFIDFARYKEEIP